MKFLHYLLVGLTISLLVLSSCQSQAGENENPDNSTALNQETQENENSINEIPQDVIEEERPITDRLDFYESQDDAEKALAIVEELGQDKTPEEAKIYLALLLADARLDEAEEESDYWLDQYPEDLDFIYLRTLVALQMGENDKRDELLEWGLSLDPENPDLNLLMATLALEQKDYSEANQYLSITLKKDPENFQALIQKADVLMHLGQGNDDLNTRFLQQAVNVLNRIEKVEPDYPYTYVDRARVLTVLGDTQSAYNDLTQAISLQPDVEWHYVDRARLTLKYRNDRQEALEDLKQCEELNPDNFLANVYMAGIYFDEMEFEKALNYYEKVISKRPDYYFAYETMGALYYTQEKYTKAVEAFLKAYDQFNPDSGYILMAALAMMRNGDILQAKQLLTEEARGLDRDSLEYEIFRFYLEGGSDYFVQDKIRKEKEESIRQKYYYYLGEYYRYLESPSSAASCFEESAELDFGFEARVSQWYQKR